MAIQNNTTELQSILNIINNLPEAGSGEPELQEKTITPTTSSQTVTPDSGYDGLSKVTVNAMPTATQATPTISVSTSGLITASSTQAAGYVAGGTKSATKQLTTQAAKTITPSTSSQTAVASGVYTTGVVTVAAIPSTYVKPTVTKDATTYTPTTSNQSIASGTYCSGTQTIEGDANLIAGNIKSGVSIFGVSGSYEGSAGEDVTEETEAYTALLPQLENVINSLPDAGSGGGGSVETCTGTFEVFAPILSATVFYMNGNMEVESKTFNAMGGSFTVAKGTIFYISSWSSMSSQSSNCTLLNYNNQQAIFSASGDFSLVYNG